MRRIYVAANPVDAQLVKSFLESAGIAARVRGEHLFGLRGGVPMTEETLPSVWVEEEEVERAQRLLEQREARARLRPVEEGEDAAGAADADWEADEQIG